MQPYRRERTLIGLVLSMSPVNDLLSVWLLAQAPEEVLLEGIAVATIRTSYALHKLATLGSGCPYADAPYVHTSSKYRGLPCKDHSSRRE